MDEIENQEAEKQRPFFLSILCFSVFVYSAVFMLIFLSFAIFNHWVFFIFKDFMPDTEIEKQTILLLSLAGIVLYGGSFLGALFIWKLNRTGLYIFFLSSLLIVLIPYGYGYGSMITGIVLSILVVAFAFFFRKLK
jgi:hypothetical protein